jgi:hypothetical protein
MPYNIGNVVPINNVFMLNGFVTDPATLVLTVTDPNGGVTTYNWPSPDTITRDGLGTFHVDQAVNIAGTWNVEWTSTGAVVSDSKTAFEVLPNLETVTITVKDQNNNPLQGANVRIFANPSLVVAGGFTNSSGIVTFQIPPGTYAVDVTLSTYVFADPFSMVVVNNNTPQSYTFDGETTGIVPLGAPTTVRLFGYLIGANGQPRDGVRVVVETAAFGDYSTSVPTASDTGIDPVNVLVCPEKMQLLTNSYGYWETDVVAGSRVRVEILDVRFYKTFVVPRGITILNVKDARPDPGPGADLGLDSDVPLRDQYKGS